MINKNIKYDANDMVEKSGLYYRSKNGKKTLTKQAEAILWYMQDVIGVTEITEDNANNVFKRIEQFEEIFGAVIVFWENDKPVHNVMEKSDVISLIGLKIKEPKKQLSQEEWQDKITKLESNRNEEERRISKQFEGVNLPDNPSIEQLAPGAEIHTQPLINMPEFAKGGK